ncbi:NUDIX domain-containing protein [Saccharothrix coeruleofusca]|uniref:DNA mismatch repair protein MutT n=1 Tax=Saccharothrix coeruleofusca TaxID=33919 RepID=A0A918EE68_9PSEU|nr:NUDIX domain-containing protein [Saccharothrix coeruleofusca]MBP2336302.1 putative NUDIX family NTP pyrophosphohydrolase [Saccharothrix coeruleofusca]GGP54019.1 DNA mismatch repair protein MutT [Saccharothrix coeruleofusca]
MTDGRTGRRTGRRGAGRRSAGILLYRRAAHGLEVLIGHMGGPFWAQREEGAWSVPKGEPVDGEQPLDTARREFAEELGLPVPEGRPRPLGQVRQAGGKVVEVWALEGDLDPARVVPGTFRVEWPRGSGHWRSYPELDRVAWVSPDQARSRLVTAQREFLDRLEALLRGPSDAEAES